MPSCSKCGGALEGATGDVCTTCLLKLGATGEIEKPLDPGTQFHGLEIVQILGRGGMGIVYKARQPQLDRFVAVKVLPRALAQDAEFTRRFLQEAKALAALTHPNIVSVHDYGREGDRPFIVMEFVDGTSLRSILKEARIKPEEALKIVPLLCDALEYAHQEGIVHRDIKPENILIDKRGRVKVADFGLAKIVSGDKTMMNLTQSNVAMGTPHYMAPEQFENTKAVDHRADIYSMGVIFYEMLTGELPIGRFELPSVKSGSDVRLDEIVMRTLEKSPDKRYQSMSDIRRDVANISTVATAAPVPQVVKTGAPWIWITVAGCLAAAVAFLLFRQTSPPTVSPSPVASSSPSPVPLDPWTAATVEIPEGWKNAQEDFSGESRGEVIEAARWFALQELAEGIHRARRTGFKGPNDWRIWIFSYQFRDPKSLDAAIKIFREKWVPQMNHFLLDKDDVIVYVSAERDGRVSPIVEGIEDTLRSKLGLGPAKRTDDSAVVPDDLPAGWAQTGSRRSDLSEITAKLKPMGLPPAGEVRDGWIASFANASAAGKTAEFLSLRFYDYEPAKEYRNILRTADPPKDFETRVLYDYTRVFVGFAPAGGDLRDFEEIVATVAKRMGYSADDVDLKTTPLEALLSDQWLILPFQVEGVNSRDLSRTGTWKVEIWSGNRKGIDTDRQCPDDILFKDGKQEARLRFGVDDEIRRFLETLPPWLQVRVAWSDKKDGKKIEFQVRLEGKYPPSFAKAFGTLFLNSNDVPMGWRVQHRWQGTNMPVIGTYEAQKAEALEVLGESGASFVRGVDMAWLQTFEPEAKLEGFKALAVLILKAPDERTRAALKEHLAKGPGAKWDQLRSAEDGEIIAVGLLAGTNADALATLDKLMVAVKTRATAK